MYLDDILIYTKNVGQAHVKAVQQIFEELQKHGLCANLKKCCFHKEEVCFLGYFVSSQGIRMEEKKIDAVNAWPEPKLVQDIQVLIEFINFYRHFIQGFSKIAVPLNSILKISPQPAGAIPATGVDDSEVVGINDGNNKKLAKSDFIKPVRKAEESSFVTFNAR